MKKIRSNILLISIVLLATPGCALFEVIGQPAGPPDISGAILTEDDVPPTFQRLSEDELADQGLTAEAMDGGFKLQQAQGHNISAFLNDEAGQSGLILSMVVYPLSQSESTAIDMELFINSLANEDYAAEMVESFGQDASLMQEAIDIGDRAIGVRYTPRDMVMYEGRGEIILFRRENALAIVMVNTIPPTQVDAVELAQSLCQKLEEALE